MSPLKNKSRMGPDLTRGELQRDPPASISRRQYYSQIQSLFDPIGLLAPVMLKAKVLLRRTWEDSCADLKWDDNLPQPLVNDIVDFFLELFELELLEFPRSLWPKEDVVGKPELIVFSDGSVTAFGTVAYIRWMLKSGVWWPMLVMSKSKIAPKNRITVPRLELNGALLAKRLREFLVEQLDMEFGNVYHLVDSSTVLGYVHKEDAKLKPFEGIRVAEIQTSGEFVEGRLKNWSWVEGTSNPADWATKPRSVSELGKDSFWQRGPAFLCQDVGDWPIRLDFWTDHLEGEILSKSVHLVCPADQEFGIRIIEVLSRISSVQKLYRIVGYMFKLFRKEGTGNLIKEDMEKARMFLIKLVQQGEISELEKSSSHGQDMKITGRYKRLAPFVDEYGIWRIGLRLRDYTPFTSDKKAPAFVPYNSRFTLLLMEQAHRRKHSGVEETVAQFRMSGFWTIRAAKLAKLVKSKCVTCRILDKQPIHQAMGGIPTQQVLSPMAWGEVEMDLFGPFLCRGEANKRSTIKVWGVVIVDRNSGAVHCDVVMDYGAQEVIKTLRRFAALRGWPAKIASDPLSQLVSFSGNL